MKFILWTMLALLALQINHANAQIVVSGPKVEMIRFDLATSKTKALAFQTYAGEIIKLNQISNVNSSKAKPLGRLIKDGLIELKTGDIFYSEELEFVATPSGEFTGASKLFKHNPLGRAPHTPK